MRIIPSLLIAILILSCNNNSITETVKFQSNDPFKSTVTPSQAFEIDAKQDNVVEGENGTAIVCPKGCFLNKEGEIVKGNVKIEISENLSLEDMVLGNLTTTSGGKLLETDGMIYFNATSNGQQLAINSENPVHFEIPTSEKKPDMMAYKGIRDEKGNMNWVEPKEIDKFLNTVDIHSLDFLPEGFHAEVEKGMPFKNYKTATQQLADSLYYNLSGIKINDLKNKPAPSSIMELYYDKNNKFTYATEKQMDKLQPSTDTARTDTHDSSKKPCGIDPARIEVIKSDNYQNSLIATKEFEARLKIIFKTCDKSVLDIYLLNLNKDLWVLDSLAALRCDEIGKPECYHAFYDFSLLRLTKVRDADKYAELLKGYFEKRLAKVKEELEKEHEKVSKVLDKKNEEAQKLTDRYKKLLWKREKYRMETYGFNWTETGWINIDNGTLPKSWGSEPLEINVENGKQYDRVYTYVIYSSIKSLYRLNSNDNESFFVGNEDEKEMLMPKKSPAVAISIAFKDEIPFLAVKEFETVSEAKLLMTLAPSSIDKVKEAINKYEKYSRENKISVDLKFMAEFYKEEQRQKAIRKENEFMIRLWNVAYPCCSEKINGEILFYTNCTSCHSPGRDKVIGPGLAEATSKYSAEWLFKWTNNAQALIKSGDKLAVKIFEENNRVVQTSFNFTEEEVSAIYEFIDDYNRGK